ncbi:hypothetical protein ERO13_D10G153700v2 [Gossypium hirsutum]|uniref:Uncharacterized protein n=3 Tax=Gossypium TaxID=3633 RepID=A0A5J5PVJ0_GOSBA|nr:hypothetical protein ES319_D10G170000v1 [Gossypium barbadense]KAG4126393.1 hypothetical protein ERO13_D10G153700v2 [Gossypium hirsutum]TYH50152.1 hypothetical protein ES332_D10G185100v1 [Gossypium tomentosum]TYI61467.1 hypothetical protein E1A91_D10G174200v1 [Gossypium mustelinum]KAB2009499.1 hypothetical protein ES319_D10G170000v1 [Gossypium barbadense]
MYHCSLLFKISVAKRLATPFNDQGLWLKLQVLNLLPRIFPSLIYAPISDLSSSLLRNFIITMSGSPSTSTSKNPRSNPH